MKNFFLAAAYIFCSGLAISQDQNKIDSLDNLIRSTQTDTIKINALNAKANLWIKKNPDKSLECIKLALELASKINYTYGIANAYLNQGSVFLYDNKFDSALSSYKKSKNLFEEIADSAGIYSASTLMGNGFGMKGDYNEALKYHLDALKYYENQNNQPSIASTLNNLAIVYTYMALFQKSLECHLRSLQIRESINDLKGVSSSLLNIAITYDKLGNQEKAIEYNLKAIDAKERLGDKKGLAQALGNLGATYDNLNNYEKATDYYLKAMVIQEEIKDMNGMSNSLVGIAGMNELRGKYPLALKYYQQALQIKKDLGEIDGEAECYFNIATVYEHLNNHKTALEYFSMAEKICLETNSRLLLKLTYEGLAACYNNMGKFENAFNYIKKFSELKDSIYTTESGKQMAEIQTKYETEKKELQIESLNKDNALKETEIKKQNIQKIGFASGFALTLLLAFVIFKGYSQKKKANKLITAQKNEVEKQKSLVDEKNKSLGVAYQKIEEKNHEILDSIRYAKRIQEAILPPQKLVKEYLEESFILYKPKDIVAGDFYWITPLAATIGITLQPEGAKADGQPMGDKGTFLFAACDCTGHGVPGAFMSILGHNGLNRCIKEFGLTQPAAILDKLCELIDEGFSKSEEDIKDGMDIALCSLQLLNNENGEVVAHEDKPVAAVLNFSGAGNSLYLISENKLVEVKADKQPIGKYSSRKPFTNHVIELRKNDSIYIFTDGYADQFGGPKGKKFKYSQFESLLLSIQDEPMDKQKIILNENIEKWKGELEQIDDICIIGVRI